MALFARKGTDAVQYALVKAHNDTRRQLAVDGSFFHADVTSSEGAGDFTQPTSSALTVAHATATDHNSAADMAAELKAKYNTHLADTLAHKVADTTDKSILATPTHATSEADLATFVTDLKAKFDTHIASTTYHYTADTTNSASGTPDATDDASSVTLVNVLKTKFNAHIAGAPAGSSVDLASP